MRRLYQPVLAGAIALLLALQLTGLSVAAQEPASELSESQSPERSGIQQIAPALPPQLRALIGSDNNVDSIERQAVWLDGRRVLRVAALADDRGNAIEEQLEAFADLPFEPSTLEVTPKASGNLMVLVATAQLKTPNNSSTADNIASTDPEVATAEILTVTVADAQRPGLSLIDFDRLSQKDMVDALAQTWADKIERSLTRFKTERQRQFLLQQLQIACGILVALLTVTMSLLRPKQRLQKKQATLAEERTAIAEQLSEIPEEETSARLPLVQRDARTQQRQSVALLKLWVIQMGEIALWIAGLCLIVGLTPYTRWLQVLFLEALRIPGKLMVVVLLTYLLIRLDDILINRLFIFFQQTPRFLIQDSQRRMLRFSTFSTVTKSITNVIFVTAGLVAALWVVGVDVGPLVAGAGIFGLAVSFAAQSLIRDIINGFLILLEDQYGVGDVVILGDVAGFVENMGLRITQLRNEEGRLITVPNGSITVVQNLTKEWSRVDLTVDVAYAADIDQALEVITAVAQELQHAPHWRTLILESPEVLGVDQLSHAGATVRLWIKTVPLKQWDVAREYRRRLKIAFDNAGIDIGTPHQAIRFDSQLARALQPGSAGSVPAQTSP
ncbi:MAG: mechanosensitive ion channel family protein [Elainellaceae cyanobacterium]